MTELIEVLHHFWILNFCKLKSVSSCYNTDRMIFLACQVISEESKNGCLIVLLKDLEKSFTGITESFSSLRNKLELLPPGVLIIGSHTQMDSRKEKVHILFLRC